MKAMTNITLLTAFCLSSCALFCQEMEGRTPIRTLNKELKAEKKSNTTTIQKSKTGTSTSNIPDSVSSNNTISTDDESWVLSFDGTELVFSEEQFFTLKDEIMSVSWGDSELDVYSMDYYNNPFKSDDSTVVDWRIQQVYGKAYDFSSNDYGHILLTLNNFLQRTELIATPYEASEKYPKLSSLPLLDKYYEGGIPDFSVESFNPLLYSIPLTEKYDLVYRVNNEYILHIKSFKN